MLNIPFCIWLQNLAINYTHNYSHRIRMMELTRLSIKTNCSPLKHSPNFNPFIHPLLNDYCVQGSEAQLPSPKLKKPQTSDRGDSHSPLRGQFSSSTGEGGRPPSHLLSREELRRKARERTRQESEITVSY